MDTLASPNFRHLDCKFFGAEPSCCEIGPEPIVRNRVKWGPFISDRKEMGNWGYFTPINGVVGPYLQRSYGTILWVVCKTVVASKFQLQPIEPM